MTRLEIWNAVKPGSLVKWKCATGEVLTAKVVEYATDYLRVENPDHPGVFLIYIEQVVAIWINESWRTYAREKD